MPDLDAFRRILRSRDPRLGIDAYADNRDRSRPAYWITYDITGDQPLKLATLESIDVDCGGRRPPGTWIFAALESMRWQQRVGEAKRQLALTKR